MATEDTWQDILRTNTHDLLVFIDTETGLEGAFKSLRLSTGLQHKSIWGVEDDTIKRKRRLLDFISIGDFERFQRFCEALVNSGQKHIVTRYLSKIKDDWTSPVNSDDPRSFTPLKESCLQCLRQNWNYLLEKIDNCTEIEIQLKSRNSLTKIQQTRLQDFKEDSHKVSYLLKLLENGSQKLFDDFREILDFMKKQELIVILTPSKTELAIDDVMTTLHIVELEPASDGDHKRKLTAIKSKVAYAVPNGVVKGRVLIFSNIKFDKREEREGTEIDEEKLTHFFKQRLKFQTSIYRDFTSEEMRQTLKDEAKQNLKDVDVFILFIMSHGINGEIYGVDDKTILTNEIEDLLDGECCPQLVGKPKLIFIQACRIVREKEEALAQTDGLTPVHEMNNNLTLKDADQEMEDNLEKLSIDDENVTLPSMIRPNHPKADMAVFYAAVKGDPAFRLGKRGTYFIQYLLDVFRRKAHTEDVVSMVTEAFGLVHDLENSKLEKRQLGEQRNSLRRKVYLAL